MAGLDKETIRQHVLYQEIEEKRADKHRGAFRRL
jgi:hypothetical protein